MIYSDLTEEMRNDIVSAVKNSLLRLGINVDVTLSAKKIYDGREMIVIETSAFNTTPVIYEEVRVHGEGFIIKVEGHDDVFDLRFLLGYDFVYFGGGENGVDIGVMNFRIFAKTQRVAFIGLTLR